MPERTAREALQMARDFRGLSYRTLARRAGMEEGNLHKTLTDEHRGRDIRSSLSEAMMARLCNAMNVSLAYRPGQGWVFVDHWIGKPESDDEILIWPNEAAKILGVVESTLGVWAKEGRVPFVTVNERGDRRYRYGDLMAVKKNLVERSGSRQPRWPT